MPFHSETNEKSKDWNKQWAMLCSGLCSHQQLVHNVPTPTNKRGSRSISVHGKLKIQSRWLKRCFKRSNYHLWSVCNLPLQKIRWSLAAGSGHIFGLPSSSASSLHTWPSLLLCIPAAKLKKILCNLALQKIHKCQDRKSHSSADYFLGAQFLKMSVVAWRYQDNLLLCLWFKVDW